MKRITTVLLAVIMAFAFSGTAFAATQTGGGASGGISDKQALAIALKDAGLTKGKVFRLDVESGKKSIEIEFTKKGGSVEFDYEIAKDGTILEKNVEYAYKHNASKSKISKKAALKKVAKHSGFKLSVVKKGTCTYKYDDRQGEYKVKFKHNGYRYEYELLAPTGKVIEWEMDKIRK